MVKRTTRKAATSTKEVNFSRQAKAAGKKERVGFTEFDEGKYTFRLREVTYGTKKDPNKKVFFTRVEFLTGEYKGKPLSLGWNVDDRAINDKLVNTDLFFFFLEDIGLTFTEATPAKIGEAAKRKTPCFTATLTKSKGNNGGVFYNLRYAEKLNKEQIAALA